MDNNKKVINGLFWSIFERVGSQGVSLIVSIVLARILLPEAYGVIAAVSVFTSLASVFVSGGFCSAIVQKKDADDKDFATMFTFNTVFSLAIYALIFFTAPFLVRIFNSSYDYELLTLVLRVLGLGIILESYNSFHRSLLTKKMQFRKIFILSLCGTVISGVIGIVMAYLGFGVWAMVAQTLIAALANTILFSLFAEWKSRIYFSFSRFRPLFSFGYKLMLSGLFISIYGDITSVAIGNKYNSDDLAYYKKGINFPKLIVLNIITAINTSLFPIMATIDDPVEMKQLVRRFNRISAFIITPMMFGFAAVATTFVELVLTEKWLPCVIFLQISCMNYAVQPVAMSSLQYLKASGRATSYLVLDIIRKSVAICLLIGAIVADKGVWLLAVSEFVANFIAIFINMYPGKKYIGYTIREQISDVLPKFALSAIMFIAVYCVGLLSVPTLVLFLLQIAVGIGVYVMLAKIFRQKEMFEIIKILKK